MYLRISSRMGCMLVPSSFIFNSPMVQMLHVNSSPLDKAPSPVAASAAWPAFESQASGMSCHGEVSIHRYPLVI